MQYINNIDKQTIEDKCAIPHKNSAHTHTQHMDIFRIFAVAEKQNFYGTIRKDINSR